MPMVQDITTSTSLSVAGEETIFNSKDLTSGERAERWTSCRDEVEEIVVRPP